MRHSDPELSPAGKEQLTRLQAHCKKLPRKTGCSRFKVVTSPMHRACETAAPIVSVLNCAGADVKPELCEVGGLYNVQPGPDGQFQKVRGNALSGQQIRQLFPGFNVASLPASGPWYTSVCRPVCVCERERECVCVCISLWVCVLLFVIVCDCLTVYTCVCVCVLLIC